MKALKIIGLVISKLGLSIGVMCLLLSFSLDGFIKGGVTSVLVSNPMLSDMFETSGIDNEKVLEIVESEEVQVLIDKYVNPFLEGNVDVSNVDIGHDLLEFVRENEDQIEVIVGEEIPLEQIETYLQSEEMKQFNETYKETVEQVQENVPVEIKNTANSARYFFTEEFRNIMFIVSVVGLVLTALLQWSPYVWLRTLGNTLTWCGVLVGCLGGIGMIFASGMLNFMGINLDFSNGFKYSLIVAGCGVICLIIYAIIKKIVGKNGAVNEVSESTN